MGNAPTLAGGDAGTVFVQKIIFSNNCMHIMKYCIVSVYDAINIQAIIQEMII